MMLEHDFLERPERSVRGTDLFENVEASPVLFDHFLDSTNLPFDPVEAFDYFFTSLCFFVFHHLHIPGMGISSLNQTSPPQAR